MGYLDVLLDFFKENNFQQFIKITYTEWILLTKSCCVQSSLIIYKTGDTGGGSSLVLIKKEDM